MLTSSIYVVYESLKKGWSKLGTVSYVKELFLGGGGEAGGEGERNERLFM